MDIGHASGPLLAGFFIAHVSYQGRLPSLPASNPCGCGVLGDDAISSTVVYNTARIFRA